MPNPTPLKLRTSSINRRNFIRYSSLAAGAAAVSGPYLLRGQNLNSKLNIAVIGAGGKGQSDTDSMAGLGENIVALCDVDETTLLKRSEKYPLARLYRDYRNMLDEMGKSIDAVTVSTPDHHHAPAAALAIKMGKHAYVQKPLTHSVYEARTLRRLAKEHKVATQMGNQGSAGSGLRRAVEVIQAGVIGHVRQVHVWSNRPIWPQGQERPEGTLPVPSNLDWDLWIGPAPMRPYNKGYHPFAWRGFQEYGTGALGDMACHTVNMPFRALKFGYPTSIEARSTGMNKVTYPRSSEIKFEFPEREGLVPVSFWWYDGDPNGKDSFRPHAALTEDIIALQTRLKKEGKLPGSGCLLIGDKGRLFSPDDYGSQFFIRMNDERDLLASKDHDALKAIPENFIKSPGHDKEWVEACKGGKPAYSNFDIAAYLTEIILLGCIALRVGKKLEWDGPNMAAKNAPEAAQYVRREYRKGWAV